MSTRPLGKVVTMGLTDDLGTSSRLTALSAHAGRATGFVFGTVKDSLPPNAVEVTGWPDARGVMMAVMARFGSRYRRATRLTSAVVTRWMAATSSAGDWRPSTARASDQADASPGIEAA